MSHAIDPGTGHSGRRARRIQSILPILAAILAALVLAGSLLVIFAPAVAGRAWDALYGIFAGLFEGREGASRYVEAVAGEPAGLNPLLHLDGAAQAATSLLFDGLTVLDSAGNVLPRLASSWDASNDSRTWTFVLRRDCAWHDGQSVTARDASFTINSLASADFPGDVRGEWQGVAARYTSDYALVVDLPAPDANFPARATVSLLPRHILGNVPFVDWLGHEFNRAPVGSGPYTLVQWQAGQQLVLAANQRYYAGAPQLPEIALRFTAAGAAPGGALPASVFAGNGAADGGLVAPSAVAATAAVRGRQVLRYPSDAYCALVPNHRSTGGERPVRLAMQAALDVGKVIDAAAGALGIRDRTGAVLAPLLVAGGPFIPGSAAAAAQPAASPQRDLAAARRLLADAGWADADGDGVREREGARLSLRLLLPASRADLAAAGAEIARQLAECGLDIVVAPVSVSEYLAAWAPPFAFDLLLVDWVNQPGDDLFEMLHSSQQPVRGAGGELRGGSNIAGVNDPQLDAILAQLRGVPLTAATDRGPLYAALMARWLSEVPQVVLWREAGFYAAPADLAGMQPGPYGVYWNINTWHRE